MLVDGVGGKCVRVGERCVCEKEKRYSLKRFLTQHTLSPTQHTPPNTKLEGISQSKAKRVQEYVVAGWC